VHKKCIFSPLKMKAEPNCTPPVLLTLTHPLCMAICQSGLGEAVTHALVIALKWGEISPLVGCTTYKMGKIRHNTTTQPQHTTINMSRCRPSLQRLWPSPSMGRPAAPPTHGAAAPYGPMQGARHRVMRRRSWFPCFGCLNATH